MTTKYKKLTNSLYTSYIILRLLNNKYIGNILKNDIIIFVRIKNNKVTIKTQVQYK